LEILNGVLKEELERLKKLEKSYAKKIAELPRGSLIKKNIRGNIYYYLNYRESKKGVFEYIGKLNKEALDKMNEKIKERKKLEKLKRQVKKDIKKLEKMINGSKK